MEADIKQKRLTRTNIQFSYESPDEQECDALETGSYFFPASLQERFQGLGEVEEKFGVLVNFPDLSKEELTMQCQILSNTLNDGGQSEVDGREMALEMQNFPNVPQPNTTTLELLTFFTEEETEGIISKYVCSPKHFQHLSLPMTDAAAAERSISKLKLPHLITYLRSTMAQDCLNGL